MGNISTFDRQRKKRQMQKAVKQTAAMVTIAVLAIAAILTYNTLYDMDVGSQAINFISSLRPGGGFPVAVDSGSEAILVPLEEDVAVVTKTRTVLYNSRGAQLASWLNTYVNPVAAAAGGKLLTYDLGGKSYRVDNKNTKIIEEQLPNPIQTAALSESGIYAVTEERKNQSSRVTVYSARGEPMYRWDTSDCQVYLLSLSRDGSRFAAGGATVKAGQVVSQLHFHELSMDEEAGMAEIPDELLLSAAYNRDGNLQVITDRSLRLYSSTGRELGMAEYQGTVSHFVNAPEGMVYLATGSDRSAAGKTVTAYRMGRGMEGQNSYTTARPIITMQYDGSRLLILTDSSLYLANSSLSQVKDRRRSDLSYICGVNGSIYGITSEGLVKEHL